MTSTEQQEETNENKEQHSFSPDIDSKALFKNLSQEKLKIILEYLFPIKLPENCKIEFIDTESNLITGFEGKGFVRSDLIFKMLTEDNKDNPKIIIEFQSTADGEMGYRLFIYSLNHSQIMKIDGELYCEPAMCMTIYSTTDKPLYGVDKVRVKKYKHEFVDLFKYKLVKTDEYYEFEYPFINILAMTKEDLDKIDNLENNDIDFLKILYLYRYRKQNKLLLDEDFYEIAKKAQDVVKNYTGKDFEVLCALLVKLIKDIEYILNKEKENNSNYGKVLDNMESYGLFKEVETIRLEGIAEGIAEGIVEGIAKGKAELIQGLLQTKSCEEVSSFLNMPLDYINEIKLSM